MRKNWPVFSVVFLFWSAIIGVCSATAQTTTPRLVDWDALVPSVEPYDDPFFEMSYEEIWDLRLILQYEEASANSSVTDEMAQEAADARARLESAGFDPEALLEQRLTVMERRREEATGVSQAFLNEQITIDGYVLPLAMDGNVVTEFFLVPWVGACIHTPPPPPNQILHVNYPEGLPLEGRFGAVRLSGQLQHEPSVRELFLIDGSQDISVAYSLVSAQVSGTPGEVVAASAAAVDLPFVKRAQLWVSGLFTTAMRQIESGGTSGSVFTALLIAFAYGALHTLGPGHGKAVVISYFVGAGGSVKRGVRMGTQIAVVHVISAVVLVTLFDVAVRQTTGAAPSDYRTVRLISYAAIALIGAFMLWQALRGILSQRSKAHAGHHAHDHNHGHDHGHGHDHSHDHHHHHHTGCAACAAVEQSEKSGNWIAGAVGIVPCTGALIVMLFGLANDLVWPAVLMVAAISLGMAVAMTAIGLAAIWGRNLAEARISNPARRAAFESGARVAGAACVLLIGMLLFSVTYWNPTFSTGLIPGLEAQSSGIDLANRTE